MAFDKDGFGLNSANFNSSLPREWSYTTTDAAAVIDSAGYFNDVADLVKVGDRIMCKIDTDGTPAYGYFDVSANNGTTVDVNDATAYGAGTDTD